MKTITKFKIELSMEILIGILLMIAGGVFTYWGYKEDEDAMGGLKYRKLYYGNWSHLFRFDNNF